MTLFEYLFGEIVSIKTDAEKYMEERNREYAKKAAAYKKREMLGEVQKTIFDYLFPVSKMNNYSNTPNTVGCSRAQNTVGYSRAQTKMICEQPGRQYRTETQYRDVASETKRRLQEKYGYSSETTSNCNDCNSFDLEKEDASLFEINTVMLDQMKQVYKVCGKIKRGRFSINDIVAVKNNGNQYNARIKQIIRQGESIDYANVSSGIIILFIPANGGLKIDKTFKITKSTLN